MRGNRRPSSLDKFFAELILDDPSMPGQAKVKKDFTSFIRMHMQWIFLGGENTTDLRVSSLPMAVVKRAWKIFVPSYKRHIEEKGDKPYDRQSFDNKG